MMCGMQKSSNEKERHDTLGSCELGQGITMVNEHSSGSLDPRKQWIRIPDGTRVRHRVEGQEGAIDGLTELVNGSSLNPDGRTQYRIDVGAPYRKLAGEDDLLILTDHEGLVIVIKQPADYRRILTERLHSALRDDRFVAVDNPATPKRKKLERVV